MRGAGTNRARSRYARGMRTLGIVGLAFVLLAGCATEETPPAGATGVNQATAASATPTEQPVRDRSLEPRVEPSPTAGAEPVVEGLPPAPSDEVCAQIVVVAWQGALAAPSTITRSEADARVLAESLLASIESGARELPDIARESSDARSSGARGGLVGTYAREEWPEQHRAIRDRVFALQPGETSEVIEAPYGWVIARRCPTELRYSRHVLVRFAGARNAGPEITRTREEARARAAALRAELVARGADFDAIARRESEDASAERGGQIGWAGRGRLAPAYEAALFALDVGAISEPIETEFGFHVIQRVR